MENLYKYPTTPKPNGSSHISGAQKNLTHAGMCGTRMLTQPHKYGLSNNGLSPKTLKKIRCGIKQKATSDKRDID